MSERSGVVLLRLLATAAWLAILTPTAHAATAVGVESTELVNDRGIDFSHSTLHVQGGDEDNDLRVTASTGGAVIVADTAGVIPGTGCTAQLDGSARCVYPHSPDTVKIDVGGGDDRVVVAVERAQVKGGPGADVLEGFVSANEDGHQFDGGPGDDVIRGSGVLTGGPGRDRLQGGEGFDRLNGDGGARLERDVIDGGPGNSDLVLFSGTSTPVVVDLARPGVAGGDRVTNVERATGGEGDDWIAGSAGVNWLEGGGGDDVLLGRGGADRIFGGGGDDRLDGAGGDDLLEGNGGRDRLTGGDGADVLEPGGRRGTNDCGDGTDRLRDPGHHMTVDSDCETLSVDYFDVRHLRLGASLSFSLQWDDTNIIPPCRTNLTVRRGQRVVATKSVRTSDGKVHRARVPLPPDARDVPLRLTFRWAQSCRRPSGGNLAGSFILVDR